MKTHFFTRASQTISLQILLVVLAVFGKLAVAHAQFEETVSTSVTALEDAWDGRQIPTTDHFVMLANSDAVGATRIALTETDVTGAVVMHNLIWDPGNPNNKIWGRALEIDLGAGGVPTGYFITGAISGGSGQQLILMRTTLTGIPTWVHYLPNIAATGMVDYEEEGVSLERQANGDIVFVGRSRQLSTGTQRMVAGRYTATGTYVWMYRYHPPAGAHINPAESCNGLRGANNTPVIGITGQYIDTQGIGHTFGSCLDAANGNELWRRTYSSTLPFDEGYDIVMNPATKRFMMVGRAINTTGQSNLWVLNVPTATGALAAGASTVYSLPNGGDWAGRDVNLTTAGNRAAIAGIARFANSTGSISTRAFLMELPFTNFAAPIWTRVYQGTEPITSGSESVVPVVATGAAVAGYFVTTDALPSNSGWTTHGAHALYVGTTGLHTIGDCPITSLQATKVKMGSNATLAKTKNIVDMPWWQLVSQPFPPLVAACDGIMPPPFNGDSDDRAADNTLKINTNAAMKVAPNPVVAGDFFRVEFAEEAAQAVLQLFDLSGKLVWQTTLENTAIAQVPTAGLPAGTYLLRTQTAVGLQTARVVIGKN